MKIEAQIITKAIEETEGWFSENYRRQLSIRETALFAINKFIELLEKPKEPTP